MTWVLLGAWTATVVGCISPESKYRLLSFFFDGVPNPSEAQIPKPTAPKPEVSRMATLRRASQVEFTKHDPYAGKECGECHESRSSNRLKEYKDALCWTCHDREDFPGKVLHGPMAAGECTACHSPHKSRFEYLLVRAPSNLCVGCHDANTFAGLEAHRAKEGSDCLSCHDPHASDRRYMLKEDEGEG